jgi:hypothetical protein
MIFFGSRASNIGNYVVPNTTCNYCELGDTQRVSVFGRYVHVFWIPIFPIGKKAVAECTHCKKTIGQKEFSPDLSKRYHDNRSRAKTPIWHWLGLGVVGVLIALIAIVGITAEVDPRNDLLSADEKLMVSNPTMESDSMSYKIKRIFDNFATEEIDPNKFKYLTKTSGDNALVLVQIPKLRKVEKEGRAQALEMIEMVTNNQPAFEGKNVYIGVKGLVSMILIRTPTYEKNSRMALSSELLDFYGPEPKKKEEN